MRIIVSKILLNIKEFVILAIFWIENNIKKTESGHLLNDKEKSNKGRERYSELRRKKCWSYNISKYQTYRTVWRNAGNLLTQEEESEKRWEYTYTF